MKKIESYMGVLLIAGTDWARPFMPFLPKKVGWLCRALLGKPSKGHPYRILIILPLTWTKVGIFGKPT